MKLTRDCKYASSIFKYVNELVKAKNDGCAICKSCFI